MSARHAPEVCALLRTQYPEKYQSMSLLCATAALHSSARIYKDAATLVDPDSGREWPALRAAEARAALEPIAPAEALAPLAQLPLRPGASPSVPPPA